MTESSGVIEAAWQGLRIVLVGADPPSPRTRSRAWTVVVAVLALGTFFIGYGSLAASRHHDWAWPLVGAAIAAPVALVPRWPLLAWRIAWVTGFVAWPLHLDFGAPWPWHPLQPIILAFVLVAVAMRHPFPVVVWVWALTVAMIVVVSDPQAGPGLSIAATVLLALGDQIRRRGDAQRGLREQSRRNEQEQARRAVLEERGRIAREMHDVVAHHMSLIAVRAESAPDRLGDTSAASAAEFRAIAEEARLSLTELRRLLGVLRQPGSGPELAPQPGLRDIADLVAAARAAGTAAALREDGDLTGVPEAVALAAYRIVQEALANAGRHAPGAPVHVHLHGTPEDIRVTVTNGPSGQPAAPPASDAHGLIGMRERVDVLGGAFAAGPDAGGGFAVHASLPRVPREAP
ncbi:MAG TPA: histidine kinase [Rugosimonospora sp.]|nr:histidine kinase [Rugosimonospora sp.]